MDLSSLSYAQAQQPQHYAYSTIPDKLHYHSVQTPNKAAFIIHSSNGNRQVISCKDLYEQSTVFAKGLVHLGVKKGDIVAIRFPNTFEWLVSTFGVQMAGGTPLHIAFKYKDGRDIIPLLQQVDCQVIVLDASNDEFIENLITDHTVRGDINFVTSNRLPCLKFCIVNDNRMPEQGCMLMSKISKLGQINSGILLPDIDPDDFATLLLTSGSTGSSKIVSKTHIHLLEMGHSIGTLLDLKPTDLWFNDRLFSWVGGYPSLFLYYGTTLVTTSDQFSLLSIKEICEFCVKLIRYENCTVSLFFPAFIQEILNSNYEIPQQRMVCSGGVPIPRKCSDVVGRIAKEFINGYGTTEFGLASFKLVRVSKDYKPYCIGKPYLGTEMKVVDKNGKILKRNEVGEIYVRKHFGFTGYYKNPEKTKEVLREDGWYRTDDLGYMDENGDFYAIGRCSDAIVCFGELISPSSMENDIQSHPSVSEVCVVPIDDPIYFQKVCACVVLHKDADLSEEELRSYLFKDTSSFKFSKESRVFLFFDCFPKTTVGKIYRKGVIEEAEKRLK